MTRVRDVRLGPNEVAVDRRANGEIFVRCTEPLGPYPEKLTARVDHWAEVAPDRVLFAQRTAARPWREVTWSEARRLARNIGQALLNRGLSPERPIAILSGNDIEHALLCLGAMYAGVPFTPISAAYSLVSTDYSKLRYILNLVTPGLVFASSGAQFERALNTTLPAGTELVVTRDPLPGSTLFHELTATPAGPTLEAAYSNVTGDTIVKFLFTSGSTGMPKGVINTQRMWTSNQAQIAACLPFLTDEPPVLVDWTPWNHTFGGNHDVGLVLYNGGTLYIDDGRPVPGQVEESIRNLREIPTTFYLNVPRGFETLVPFLRNDEQLRKTFFSRLKLMWYAGASLSQPVWDELDALSIQTTGERVLMLTGLGATETAPFAMAPRKEVERAGMVGIPAPDLELKLVPSANHFEARLKGPNITPGYWRQPELTQAAFDDEGYYKLGDALAFADPANPQKGFVFSGRVSEDFKLATGTWVHVGPLRTRILAAGAGWIRDVVIAGHDRDYVAALIFPSAATTPGHLPSLLAELDRKSTGSSNRILRAILLTDPPSLDAHEVTDKGSINQKAVLSHRAAIVEDLYAAAPPASVVQLEPGGALP